MKTKTQPNSTFAIVGVLCSLESLFSVSTFVLKMATFARPKDIVPNFKDQNHE